MELAGLKDPRGQQVTIWFYSQTNPSAESLQTLPLPTPTRASLPLVSGPRLAKEQKAARGESSLSFAWRSDFPSGSSCDRVHSSPNRGSRVPGLK